MQKLSDVIALKGAIPQDFQYVPSHAVGTPSGGDNQGFVLTQILFLCVKRA